MLCEATLPTSAELCAPCAAELPRLAYACARCAAPLPAPAAACGACQQMPPAFARAAAVFHYSAPIDRLIQRFKFHGELALTRLFAGELAAVLARDAHLHADLIVPVPLHRTRLRERGYNQALELARPLAKRFGIALDAHGVQRVVATAPQAELSRAQRRRNLRKAFAATRRYDQLRVAIVDDVMTTGSTVEALARCLKAAGAAGVDVWVIARA